MISGIDISYRAVEGLYSDGLVMMALRNLHVPLLRGEITRSDAASGRIFIDLGILCVGIGVKPRGMEMKVMMRASDQWKRGHLLILLG